MWQPAEECCPYYTLLPSQNRKRTGPSPSFSDRAPKQEGIVKAMERQIFAARRLPAMERLFTIFPRAQMTPRLHAAPARPLYPRMRCLARAASSKHAQEMHRKSAPQIAEQDIALQPHFTSQSRGDEMRATATTIRRTRQTKKAPVAGIARTRRGASSAEARRDMFRRRFCSRHTEVR